MYQMTNTMYPQYPNTGLNNYNPYQSMFNTQNQAQIQTLTRVTGIEGARAYQMNANSTVALFDSNEDLMYIKTTDGAGFPTIRTFSFSEIFDNKPQIANNEDYVSKNEFETFKQEVTDYVQQFIQQQTKSNKQIISTNGISEELRKSRSNGSTDVSE